MANPVLIIGGGLAGLFCALKLAPTPVTILSTAPLGTGASSVWAQGGIAAALSDGDTPEEHAADTLVAGAGICDEPQVLSMAREAAARIRDLLAFGVPFDRDLEGRLLQSREAAHSQNRIVRVKGDVAGKAIMQALHIAADQSPSITVLSGRTAVDLVTRDGTVCGVKVLTEEGKFEIHHASAVILATGGAGHLFQVTTNPVESRGLGLAIAARAGAVIADPEFVQFHPTAINVGKDPAPLATEALRGEGATLVNSAGERFMLTIHKDAELAPRDVVARGVFAEVQAGRGAFLDARQAVGAEFPVKFPTVYAHCKAAGIDPVTDPIPVIPAEHFHMGGVATDDRGRSSLPGLWAVGEVAATGVHGANRLASNSLLEAVVYAARIAEELKSQNLAPVADMQLAGEAASSDDDGTLEQQLRRVMHEHVGVMRDAAGLAEAVQQLQTIGEAATGPVLQNMALAALVIAGAASLRLESRGGHFRTDYPKAEADWQRRTMLTLESLVKVLASC